VSLANHPDRPLSAAGAGCAPSGFFAFRTPLLPFDELLAWGEGLAAPGDLDDPANLERALEADKIRLRAYLRDVLARPEVREALFVASPDLDESLGHWLSDPESERGQKVERAVVRYVVRMAGRATPFGLFSGCSIGTLSRETRLVVAERGQYQRHTRLDMDYLFALAEALGRDPALRRALRYRPNSSLYRAAGRVRYAEARLSGKTRSYHLVAVDPTSYLDCTLDRAAASAPLADLAAGLVADDPEVAIEEADAYIGELIDSQMLVSDLAPAVTGPEPIHDLIAQLGVHAHASGVAGRLDEARAALAAIDQAGIGQAPDAYRVVARLLDSLPAEASLSRLFQVDLAKPASAATLGDAVLDEIARGVDLLHRLSGARQDGLARFREAFTARYEGRAIPLVEALDEESGVGFAASGGADAAPLLDGLAFPPAAGEPTTPWGARQALLLRKVEVALRDGAREIEITPADLEAIGGGAGSGASAPRLPLPDSFAVMAMVAAESETALNQGRFQVLIDGVSGPSGARLLGRFCHADPALRQQVEQHLRAEEALRPDAIFAEIIHLPEGRIGNILCRPVLRGHEIAYLGRSGACAERQLPIADLLVSVEDGRIVLRSERLGREVIPRLTSAHNYAYRSLGVYRFLCALQNQGVAAGLGWDWGALEGAAFLPRVSNGRLVLARARWRVEHDELRTLGAVRGAARFHAAQEWRARRRLPRWVVLADGDNELPIDLDNALSVESFVDLVKGRGQATLVELFPGPDQLCAQGPEGRFVHELVVPFVRSVENQEPWNKEPTRRQGDKATRGQGEHGQHAPHATCHTTHDTRHATRRFPPGSEWPYVKLYTGAATADQVLCEVVGPVVDAAWRAGAANSWFFIRYGDPDWHLRLRVHADPERQHSIVLPALQQAVAPLLEDGRIWRMQLDTYEREVERYGGAAGMQLAERLFHADSAAALRIVELLDGDAGADARWRLALRGIDMLLDDLGFELVAKHTLLSRVRDGFAQEFRADGALTRQLGAKFRQERKSLEALLDPASDEASPLAPGIAVLRERSDQLAPVVAALRGAERAGRLALSLAELAPSYVHMHANRMLRSAQRAQELVLYDFLSRLYESRIARARGRR
jgi:thiopeptide-type bacteriocin biosynthesis protein